MSTRTRGPAECTRTQSLCPPGEVNYTNINVNTYSWPSRVYAYAKSLSTWWSKLQTLMSTRTRGPAECTRTQSLCPPGEVNYTNINVNTYSWPSRVYAYAKSLSTWWSKLQTLMSTRTRGPAECTRTQSLCPPGEVNYTNINVNTYSWPSRVYAYAKSLSTWWSKLHKH